MIQIGDIVQRSDRTFWYGKVFGFDGDRALVAVFATRNGLPHRKVKRRKLHTDMLTVTRLPESYTEEVPSKLPDPPTGTPRRKFIDTFKVGDEVGVIRYEHGWEPGCGVIISLSDYCCTVRLDEEDGGHEIPIDHPRDLSGPYRP